MPSHDQTSRSGFARAAAIAVGALSAPALAQLSHWKFDEPSGTTAFDSAGTVSGALRGDAAFAPGQGVAGGAVSMTQAGGGRVSMGDAYQMTGGVPFSVALWVKTSSGATQFPLGRHHTGFLNGYLIGIGRHGGGYGEPNRPHLYVSHSPGGEARAITTVTDGQWHHIVGVYAPSTPSIFVDGAPAEGAGRSTSVGGNTAPFIVGGLWNGSSELPLYTGLIDDAQVYGCALAESAVDWLFTHPGQPLAECRADCEASTGCWTLDIFDFLCFQNRYDAADPYACDCDTQSGPGVCDIFDFLCFQNAFAAGCP